MSVVRSRVDRPLPALVAIFSVLTVMVLTLALLPAAPSGQARGRSLETPATGPLLAAGDPASQQRR